MRTFSSTLAGAFLAAAIAAPSLALAQQGAASDYSLQVVSAVLPAETAGASTDLVTLVVENRGSVDAPLSLISVAPRDHLSLARQSAIPALHPGQRTTIQLPVQIAATGTSCISITITAVPIPDPAIARFLAAAIPEPMIEGPALSASGYPSPFHDVAVYGELAAFGDL
ncbi:MAG TPA: hypothetical protein VIG47_06375 [Gemmatimonadaceae bacterium]